MAEILRWSGGKGNRAAVAGGVAGAERVAYAAERSRLNPLVLVSFITTIYKVWVTRRNIFIDRIASGWLIRRFVNPDAVFRFVDPDSHSPGPDEIRFDMFNAEFTHEGDQCTFETMIRRLGLKEPGLEALAEVVHDIDLKDAKYGRPEADGLFALLSGLAAVEPNDGRCSRKNTARRRPGNMCSIWPMT